jgi:DegV family protein with EDD domain
MGIVRIVTDSTAHFLDPSVIERYGVTIVPLHIQFGQELYRDGVDIDTAEFFQRAAESPMPPVASSPSPEDFARVYTELGKQTDRILSIHISSKLSRTYRNARTATDTLLGRCKIQVVDSMTTSLGLGILVEAAAHAGAEGESLDEIVRTVRGMIPRIYVVFFVETLDYLERGGRLSKSQAILGTMLGIKPFLTIEEGDIIPMEKVRTRDKAVEKLVEFVAEFSALDTVAILHSNVQPNEDTRLLLERLAVEFPGRHFPLMTYGPALACHIGPNSLGVIVYEASHSLHPT